MASDTETKEIIQEALKDHNFQICDITLNGSTDKSNGYASHITFATVKAITADSVEKEVEIAVKSSKNNLIEVFKNVYQRESYFYKVILPEFDKFQFENNVENKFDSIPLCYKIISDKSMEVLVMENLRKIGYCLYDRKIPLTLEHHKLVLQEYGKFHAISFAFRQKRKNDFDKLVSNLDEVMIDFLKDSVGTSMQQSVKRVCGILKSINENELYEMCNTFIQKDVKTVVVDLLETVEPVSAILHGDCWNNNFLFKYESEDRIHPSKAAILDWQLTRLHSPVLDISQFIYTTSSEEQLEHFDELLDVYYKSFSTFLTQLGCDPEELFPFATLLMHWKKYAIHGMITLVAFLHMLLCDEEDAPELDDVGGEKNMGEKMSDVPVKDEAEYRKRLLAVLKHYYKFYSS